MVSVHVNTHLIRYEYESHDHYNVGSKSAVENGHLAINPNLEFKGAK